MSTNSGSSNSVAPDKLTRVVIITLILFVFASMSGVQFLFFPIWLLTLAAAILPPAENDTVEKIQSTCRYIYFGE